MARPIAVPTAPNLLEESGLPLAYPVRAEPEHLLRAPDPEDHEVALRSLVRSLTVMQKEAVVVSSRSSTGWRMASDEGPYLQGHDHAPAPLAFLTAGLATDFFAHIERGLDTAGHETRGLGLRLDTRFTMEGSLPRGTMVGGALAPEIVVQVDADDPAALTGEVMSGLLTAPSLGLITTALANSFSLTSHDKPVPVGRVDALDEDAPPPDELPTRFPTPALAPDGPLIAKTASVGEETPDAGTSYDPDQQRTLHLQATTTRADGVVAADVRVIRPVGSTFQFLCDEPTDGMGGRDAPDALSILSAGIGFCFMTQIGRYAKIMRRSLGGYQIVQDTRFSNGDPRATPPVGGRADSVRTHVYLAPDESTFAPAAVDMSEQTCFVHALCRTELRPKVRVERRS